MSKVAIQGNASGTGTFTIAAPNSNTDRTLTLPDEAGTVLTSASSITPNAGAIFSAYPSSGQSFSAGVYTKVLLDQTEYNEGSAFSTANSRFVAPVNGYYYFSAQWTASASATGIAVVFYVDGVETKGTSNTTASTNWLQGSAQLYLTQNQYVEFYARSGVTQNSFTDNQKYTWFSGHLIREA